MFAYATTHFISGSSTLRKLCRERKMQTKFRKNSSSYKIPILAILAIGLLPLFSPDLGGTAVADEPVTITVTVTVVVEVTIVAAAVIYWVWDSIFGDDEANACTTTTVTTTETVPSETGPRTRTVTETKTTYAHSPASIVFPDDFPEFEVPPGFAMAETTYFDPRPDFHFDLQYLNFNYRADVLDPSAYRFGVSYDTTRTTQFRLLRPEDEPGQPSMMRLPIHINGFSLRTTNIPGTYGTSLWEWTIASQQLGVIFHSLVVARQGQSAIVAGDIHSEHFVFAEGRVDLPDFDSEVEIIIPAGISALDVEISLRTRGAGARSTRGDVNCDFWINNFDIDAFVLALSDDIAFYWEYPACDIRSADMNDDGAVNNFDIDPFIECITNGQCE